MNRRQMLRLLAGGSLGLAGWGCRPSSSDQVEVAPTTSAQPDPTAAPEDDPTASSTPDLSPAPLVLICRDDWGARPARDGMRPHTNQRLMVHHSGTIAHEGQGLRAMREYQDLHLDHQGWADIAYHVGVDRDGHAYELRDWDRAGDTATPYDPAGHFLLLLDGNFQQQRPTEVQFETGARVLAWAADHFGLSLDTLTGHRDHVITACPGDAVYRRLDELAQRAADHRRAGVELRRTC